ncbi:hypothetical protein DM49_4178 [Burkholderia mallei]|nr:hypothetical protein DM49_4178 [Burkholderia mallei]
MGGVARSVSAYGVGLRASFARADVRACAGSAGASAPPPPRARARPAPSVDLVRLLLGPARPRHGFDFPGIDRLAAFGAHHHRMHHVSASAVAQHDGRAVAVVLPAVSPRGKREQYRIQIQAFLRQAIFEARRPVLIRALREDAFVDEPREPLREHVTGESQLRLERFEAAMAEKCVAQDQHRPAVAEHGERASDRTRHRADVVPFHDRIPGKQGKCVRL